MRAALAVLIVLVVTADADAQTIGLSLPSIGLPLPSIGLPLPQIGLPLPSTGLPPVRSATQSPARPSPPTNVRRPPGNMRPGRGGKTLVYFVPAFGWEGLGSPVPVAEPPPVPSQPATGHLIVELEPDVDPQMFIDGYFVGSFDDSGGDLPLAPGVHRLELRADDYEPLVVDVLIIADRSTRYRASLVGGSASRDRPLGGTPAAVDNSIGAARPATELPTPSTIYVVPGCYIGNLPPLEVTLPAGCDPSRVTVFPSRR